MTIYGPEQISTFKSMYNMTLPDLEEFCLENSESIVGGVEGAWADQADVRFQEAVRARNLMRAWKHPLGACLGECFGDE